MKDEKAWHASVHAVATNAGLSESQFSSFQLLSHAQLFMTLWTAAPHFPVHNQHLELAQTHDHRVSDAIQPSHSLSSPFPPAFNLSQYQGLFQ